ncbi:MAG: dipeptidase [Romboutsia sp.]
MKLIDLHCDTIDKLMVNVKESRLLSNEFSVDIQKLKEANSLAQTFALYVDIGDIKKPFDYCMSMADKFFEEIKINSDVISLARNYDEIIKNEANNKLSAILSIEEGAVLEGEMDNLNKFYNLGVRMMTLTWNYANEIGYPHHWGESKEIGLTSFGKDVVQNMNDIGMLVDVSHLSDAGFYDVAKISTKPFIATHSNSRKMMNHSRNLNDDMIKILGDSGGVTGLNFCHSFLSECDISKIDHMVKHIKHIVNVGGIDVMSIGTDFDGIDSEVEINDISEMNKLICGLEKSGFTYDEIEKIYYKNALRVIKEVL